MSVKFSFDTPTYNKTPTPDKIPSDKLYTSTLLVNQQQQAWVSLPQPDKLTLVGDVLPSQFSAAYSDKPIDQLGPYIMSLLASGQMGKVVGNPKYTGEVYLNVQIAVATWERWSEGI